MIDYPSIANTQVVVGGPWNSSLSNFACLCDIGDVRIYPRALSAAEVKYLCNGFQPNLIIGQTIPSGAILDLSARGLTTSGIAQANGVVDRSGNGNHGQAYNGVSVVNDDEMGSCFSSNAENTYIAINSNIYPLLSNVSQITFACRVKLFSFVSQQTRTHLILVAEANGSARLLLSISTNGKIEFGGRRIAGETMKVATSQQALSTNVCYLIIGVADFSTKELKIYLNGEEISTDGVELNSSGVFSQPSMVQMIGFVYPNVTPFKFSGYLSDVRIYPRALTASEVQQLADASLKKITNIKSGSSDVRQIFSNGEMIYAKTNDYSLNL